MLRKPMRQPALALLAAGLLLCACSQDEAPAANTSDPGQATRGADEIDRADLSRAAGLALTCGGCHAPGGQAVKDIEGYTSDAIRTALSRYKLETDGTTVMHRLVRGYSDDDIVQISDYLGHKKGDAH